MASCIITRVRPVASAVGLCSRRPILFRASAVQLVEFTRSIGWRAFAASAEGTSRTISLEGTPSPTPDHSAADRSSQDSKSSAVGGSEKPKDEPEKTSSWVKFVAYALGTFSGLTFFYYFYKSGYNFHKTETAMLQSFRRLPLYYPPSNRVAEINGTVDGEGLSAELVLAFSEWFMTVDTRQSEGVTRDDVLELIREMGFDENCEACQRYLERGQGTCDERRRLSGTGLQEAISLLAGLALHTAPPQTAIVGSAAVELLQQKVRGVAKISSGAAALQQAMHGPMPMGAMGMGAQVLPPQIGRPVHEKMDNVGAAIERSKEAFSSVKRSIAMEDVGEDVDDTAHQLQLEIARLRRMEESLIKRLESRGSLSAAEEDRLRDIRAQQADLKG